MKTLASLILALLIPLTSLAQLSGGRGEIPQGVAHTFRLCFVDATDGDTAEDSLTISQADIRVSKAGGDMAQTNNATGATHDEGGCYSIPLDATDTNTVGDLEVFIHESGALAEGAVFKVIPADLYLSRYGVGGSAGGLLHAQIIGDTGNSAGSAGTDAALHLEGHAWGDDVPNNLMASFHDNSTGLKYTCAVKDFATTGDILTLDCELPAAPEADTDYVEIWGPPTATISEVQSDLATEAKQDTAQADLDIITGADGVVIESSNDGTQFTEAGGDGDHLTEAGGTGDQLTALASQASVDTAQADLDTITGADGVNLLSGTQTQIDDIETDAAAILVDTGTSGVIVNEVLAAGLADFFNTDSGTTYGSAVAGSVVAEIADNAGGSALTEGGIADAVWDEAQSGHTTGGTFGELATEIAAILVDTAEIGTAGAGLTEAGGTGDQLTALASQASVDTAQADLDIITGADGVNLLSATQTQVNDIEADATAILADTDDIGVAGAGLTEAGGTGDQLTAVPWNAAWDAEVESEVEDAVGADVTAVLADTGELQGDWANGGRLDLLLDAIPTQVLGLPTSTAATNIPVWGFDSDNDPVTGVSDWACVISRDGGAASPVTDTTEAEVDAGDIPGYYVVDLTQVETNGSAAVLYCTGTGVVPWILNIEFRE